MEISEKSQLSNYEPNTQRDHKQSIKQKWNTTYTSGTDLAVWTECNILHSIGENCGRLHIVGLSKSSWCCKTTMRI